MSLPEKFNSLITAWDSVSVENQTRANLIERLIKEEQRLTITDKAAEALATMSIGKRNDKQISNKKFNNSNFKIKDKKSIECYFCHKLGHFARDCRKRKHTQRYKRDDNSAGQMSNEQRSNSDNNVFVVTEVEKDILKDIADNQDIWLLDSGASKHMSFQKIWFDNFVEINESVCLGDNSTCKMKGRG